MQSRLILPRQYIVFSIQKSQQEYYFMLNTICSHSFASHIRTIGADESPTGYEIICQPAPFSLNAWSEQIGLPLEGMIGQRDLLRCQSIAFDWDQRLCYIDEIPPFMQDVVHKSSHDSSHLLDHTPSDGIKDFESSTHDQLSSLDDQFITNKHATINRYVLDEKALSIDLQVATLQVGPALLDSSCSHISIPSTVLEKYINTRVEQYPNLSTDLGNISQPNFQSIQQFHSPSFQGILTLTRYTEHSIKLAEHPIEVSLSIVTGMPPQVPALIGLSYWMRHHMYFEWKDRILWTQMNHSTQTYSKIESYISELPFQISIALDSLYAELLESQWNHMEASYQSQIIPDNILKQFPPFCIHSNHTEARTGDIPTYVYQIYQSEADSLYTSSQLVSDKYLVTDQSNISSNSEVINDLITYVYRVWQDKQMIYLWSLNGLCTLCMTDENNLSLKMMI
jgi:hypothetical protein